MEFAAQWFAPAMIMGIGMGFGCGTSYGTDSANKKVRKQIEAALRASRLSVEDKNGERLSATQIFEILDTEYKKV